MLAIAGSKGGCGKTTLALGLANAFSRAGTPTLVVDGDRQMPNVHIAAGVPREPTIGDLAAGTHITEVAHDHPEAERVKLLCAPHPDETVDFPALLSNLQSDRVQTIIDCPAGIGPDATDPLEAAEETIVVTSLTEQSLAAAEKTIEVASRLDVDVYGVVINKCETDRDTLEELPFDVPVLETIPECATPLSDPDAVSAYETVVNEYLNRTVSTGIPTLDRELGGGFPTGTVLELKSDQSCNSELLLHPLTAARGTLYISTEKSPQVVSARFSSSDVATGVPEIAHVDGETALEEATSLVASLPPESTVIVDSIDSLERFEPAAYIPFLNTLAQRVHETDSIAILYTPDRSRDEQNKSSTREFTDIRATFETVDNAQPGSDTTDDSGDGADAGKTPVTQFTNKLSAGVSAFLPDRSDEETDRELPTETEVETDETTEGDSTTDDTEERETNGMEAHSPQYRFSITSSRTRQLPISSVTLRFDDFFEDN